MQYFSWTTPVNACIGPDIIHFTHSSLLFFSRTCRRPMPHMHISRITRFSLLHGRGIDHHYYAHFISVLFFFHLLWLPYTINLTFLSYSTHMSTWFIFPLPSCNSRWFVWLVKWSIIFHSPFFVHILNQFLHLDCTLHFSWHFRVFPTFSRMTLTYPSRCVADSRSTLSCPIFPSFLDAPRFIFLLRVTVC